MLYPGTTGNHLTTWRPACTLLQGSRCQVVGHEERPPSHPQQFRCGFLYDRLGIQDARHGGRIGRTLGDHGHWAWALGITWVGTVQDRWASSPILAAARGSLELISTGALISMECLWLAAWEDLCVTLSAVKEWRFLAFFLLSTRR